VIAATCSARPTCDRSVGPSGDLGGVWAPAKPIGDIDRIFLEADAFAHRAHDTIAFITSAGFVARAANIGDTQAYGAELVASARYAQVLSVTASYTPPGHRAGSPAIPASTASGCHVSPVTSFKRAAPRSRIAC